MPELDEIPGGRRHGAKDVRYDRYMRWLRPAIFVLSIVNLLPVVFIVVAGEIIKSRWHSFDYSPSLAIVAVAAFVSIAGLVGVRSRWSLFGLFVLALVMMAWPLFLAWVFFAKF